MKRPSPAPRSPAPASRHWGLRLIAACFLAAAAGLIAWNLPVRKPCWRVHAVDWAFRQRGLAELGMFEVEAAQELARKENIPVPDAVQRHWKAVRSPEQQRLAGLPLSEFIAAATGSRVAPVAGSEWSLFFQTVEDALGRKSLPARWAGAVDRETLRNGRFASLFLSENEPPFPELGAAARDGRPFYLRLEPDRNRTIEVEWITPNRDEGTEIGPYDWPIKWLVPDAFRWPLRRHALWFALLGASLPLIPLLGSRALLPRIESPRGVPEILRRAGFFTLASLAIILACWTHLVPYWTVSRKISREEHNRIWASMAAPLIQSTLPGVATNRAQAQQLAAEILDLRQEGTPKTIEVSGPEWESFLSKVATVLGGGRLPPGWERRVDDWTRRDLRRYRHLDTEIKRLAFLGDEPPLASLASSVQFNEEYLARLEGRNGPGVSLHLMPAPEVTGFGHTSFGLPSPMAYPFRSAWPWLLAAALVVYLVLPWRRVGSDTIAWATWRLVLSDFAAALLFLPFFGLPFFIIGSTQHALTVYAPFTAIFWILAALGAYLILWCIRYACWSVQLLPDGFRINTLSRSQVVPYDEVTAIQRAVLRPPKWLVILSYIAIFLPSKGSARMGQAGRAMILSSSSTGGLVLHLRSGPSPVLWVTDQMGNTAVRNFDKLTAALESRNLPHIEEVLEFRRITPPDFADPAPGKPHLQA